MLVLNLFVFCLPKIIPSIHPSFFRFCIIFSLKTSRILYTGMNYFFTHHSQDKPGGSQNHLGLDRCMNECIKNLTNVRDIKCCYIIKLHWPKDNVEENIVHRDELLFYPPPLGQTGGPSVLWVRIDV